MIIVLLLLNENTVNIKQLDSDLYWLGEFYRNRPKTHLFGSESRDFAPFYATRKRGRFEITSLVTPESYDTSPVTN